MTSSEYGRYWNVTLVGRAESFECDSAMDGHTDVERWLRAIDVDAPVDVTYRWLCQFTIAPYSYDWIDNIGRRSPKTLTAGAGDVAIGQRFLVFRITAFAADDHITGRYHARLRSLLRRPCRDLPSATPRSGHHTGSRGAGSRRRQHAEPPAQADAVSR